MLNKNVIEPEQSKHIIIFTLLMTYGKVNVRVDFNTK